MFMYFFSFFIFVFVSMFFKTYHLLSFLIGVEMMVLFLLFCMLTSGILGEYFFLMAVFLSFAVCESILGLVLFVLLARFYSKDYLLTLNLLVF